jgi:hypothetical protein
VGVADGKGVAVGAAVGDIVAANGRVGFAGVAGAAVGDSGGDTQQPEPIKVTERNNSVVSLFILPPPAPSGHVPDTRLPTEKGLHVSYDKTSLLSKQLIKPLWLDL